MKPEIREEDPRALDNSVTCSTNRALHTPMAGHRVAQKNGQQTGVKFGLRVVANRHHRPGWALSRPVTAQVRLDSLRVLPCTLCAGTARGLPARYIPF